MARGKGKQRKGKARDAAPQGGADDSWQRTDVVEKADMQNERLIKYYKAQNILPDEEWEPFMASMRELLPTTFRVAGSRQTARLLNDTIKETYAPHLAGVVFEGEAVSPPTQIPWYPDGLAWQLNVAKKVLRKSPEFKRFHNFLVGETEVGNISRQEAVSMLPPLFLEVEPHHRVIDMCAAPGSKTAQLLEALHAQDTATASSYPTGLLIANDSDHKRTHMLIHQAARLPSPSLMVTNHDASIYPAIRVPAARGTQKTEQLLFDRILCDVPCSGDGTIRKNPGIWKHWSPMDGNGLHGLQLRILERAMRMLQKGGRIVYSTCSMNPMENEAVIAAALRSMPGFELVDMSEHLPGLVFRPGLSSWRPAVDRSVDVSFATYEDYIQSLPEGKRAESKMLASHWPPTPAEAEELRLNLCMRIYPHLQDTGGFFVAVLQKKPSAPGPPVARELPEGKRQADAVEDLETSEGKKVKLSDELPAATGPGGEEGAERETAEDTPLDPSAGQPTTASAVGAPVAPGPAKGSTGKGKKATKGADLSFKENPFTFLQPDDAVIKACIAQLNLKADFPAGNVLIRNPTGETVRSMYMTNDIVRDVVQHNDYTRMRLVTCGTKVLGKQEGAGAKREGAEGQFRVLSEGLPVMLPYIEPASVLGADVATLRVLLESYYPVCSQFQERFRSAIEPRGQGCYIVRFAPGRLGTAALSHDLVLPIWKSTVSVTLMLDKKAKSALSLRVFGEDITAAAREAAQARQAAAAETEAAADAQAHVE